MRRVLVALLGILFIAQSSSVALAASPGAMPTPGIDLAGLLAPLRAAAEDTPATAFLTGTQARAAAMHLRRPEFHKPESHDALLPHNQHAERPKTSDLKGIAREVLFPPPPPRERVRDPRAMRRSGVPTFGAGRLGTRATRTLGGSRQANVTTADATPTPTPADAGAGFSSWWTFASKAIPGLGMAYVNVGTGNAIISTTDVDVPETGLDLSLHRVFNSMSLHNVNADDGGEPAVYGNGWTNELDAHVVYRPGSTAATTFMTVYDVDGKRNDFQSDGNGNWIAPAGVRDTLEPQPGNDCNYYLIRPDGSYLWFRTSDNTTCGIAVGNVGRLYEIVGRNHNNWIRLNITWANGNDSTIENLQTIVLTHSDGQSLTLTFGKVGTWTELSSVTRPDGAELQYLYDTSGDLEQVDKPGNASALSEPDASILAGQGVPSGDLAQSYSKATPITRACGPRGAIALWSGSYNDGDCVDFEFNASNQLTSWYDMGVLNPTPSDGTGLPLQSGPTTNWAQWNTATFTYGADGDICSAGLTCMADTNGHATDWTRNGSGSVTQTTGWPSSTTTLVASQSWNADNELTAVVTPAGNETDYGYDANNDLVEVSGPAQSLVQPAASPGPFTLATVRPTTTFTYSNDGYDNLLAVCDPYYNAENGKTWTASPSNGLCGAPGAAPNGSTSYTYNSTTDEPYGEITSVTSPLGYVTTVAYTPSDECPGCSSDYGLPTSATGAQITNQDGSTRTPTAIVKYDAYGDVLTYNNGVGTTTLTYGALNQPISEVDADGVSSWVCYNPEGDVQYTETAYQHHLDGNPTQCEGTAPAYAVAYSYDPDRDQVSETHHFNGSYVGALPGQPSPSPSLGPNADTTSRFYDGLDRLVEVQEPVATSVDIYKNPWTVRYLYSLMGEGDVSFNGGAGHPAYGNLYKTQELLPSGASSVLTFTAPGSGEPTTHINNNTFQDVKGFTYDGLDRTTSVTTLVTALGASPLPSSSPTPTANTTTITYDANGFDGTAYPGMPNEVCNGLGQCEQYGYSAGGSLTHVQWTGAPASSDRTMLYDTDGRVAAVASGDAIPSGSTGVYQNTYDADGNVTSESEPATLSSSATITHAYYKDDLPSALSIASSGLTQPEFSVYSYNSDDTIKKALVNDGTLSGSTRFGTTTFTYTRTAAGRLLDQYVNWPNAAPAATTAFQYDAYGHVSSQTFPGSQTLSGFEYNAEDGLLGYSGPGTGQGATYSYDTRGELITGGYYANGVSITASATTIWDDRMGVPLSLSIPATYSTMAWGYDAAGRMTNENLNPESGNIYQTTVRAFDRENHLLSTQSNNGQVGGWSSAETWGANGSPSAVGSAFLIAPLTSPTASDTLHWSGGQVLFTTNASSQLDDLKAGSAGDILPQDPVYKPLTLYDQGPDQAVGGCYNADAQTAYADTYPYPGTAGACGAPASTTPSSPQWWGAVGVGPATNMTAIGGSAGGTIAMPRPDGFTTGTDTIQGVRSYDQVSGTWTAPDAYPSSLMNPLTLKPYVWNGNNPIANQDPSGFGVVTCTDNGCWEANGTGAAGGTFNQDGELIPFGQAIPLFTENYALEAGPGDTLNPPGTVLSSWQAMVYWVDNPVAVSPSTAVAYYTPQLSNIFYRAISSDEATDIQQNGFQSLAGQYEGKLFFRNMQDMQNFARMMNTQDMTPYTNGVTAKIPEGVPIEDVPLNSVEGPAVYVPEPYLPEIEPIEIFPL